MSRQAILRSFAALLLPLLILSSTGFAYSFAVCRHDQQVHLKACCRSKLAAAQTGPALTRGCCDVHTIRFAQPPAEVKRHEAGARPMMTPPIALLPTAVELWVTQGGTELPQDVPTGASGPPILLVTRALLI